MACSMRFTFAVSRLPLEIIETSFVFLYTVLWTSLYLEGVRAAWLGSLWQTSSLQICRTVVIWTGNKKSAVGQRGMKVTLYPEKFICVKIWIKRGITISDQIFLCSLPSLQKLLTMIVHKDTYLRIAIFQQISTQVESEELKFQTTWDKDSL